VPPARHVGNTTSSGTLHVYRSCMRRVVLISSNPLTSMRGKQLEASMEHVSSHNAFNILFGLSFFASLAVVMFRFG
jgi:hypothetical protein